MFCFQPRPQATGKLLVRLPLGADPASTRLEERPGCLFPLELQSERCRPVHCEPSRIKKVPWRALSYFACKRRLVLCLLRSGELFVEFARS